MKTLKNNKIKSQRLKPIKNSEIYNSFRSTNENFNFKEDFDKIISNNPFNTNKNLKYMEINNTKLKNYLIKLNDHLSKIINKEKLNIIFSINKSKLKNLKLKKIDFLNHNFEINKNKLINRNKEKIYFDKIIEKSKISNINEKTENLYNIENENKNLKEDIKEYKLKIKNFGNRIEPKNINMINLEIKKINREIIYLELEILNKNKLYKKIENSNNELIKKINQLKKNENDYKNKIEKYSLKYKEIQKNKADKEKKEKIKKKIDNIISYNNTLNRLIEKYFY